jgi:hypothetical protein
LSISTRPFALSPVQNNPLSIPQGSGDAAFFQSVYDNPIFHLNLGNGVILLFKLTVALAFSFDLELSAFSCEKETAKKKRNTIQNDDLIF